MPKNEEKCIDLEQGYAWRRQDIPFGVSLGKRPRSESEGAETGAKGDSVSASSLREEYRVKGVKLLWAGFDFRCLLCLSIL